MPLTWDVRRIKDHEKVTTDPENPKNWNPVTQSIVWTTTVIGINEITEKNYEEAYFRTFVKDALYGGSMTDFTEDGIKKISPSLNDFKNHIGLFTNANTFPRTKFLKSMRDWILEEAKKQPDHNWVWK